MNKQIDLLSFNNDQKSNLKSNSSDVSSKKEGSSLFDALLMRGKDALLKDSTKEQSDDKDIGKNSLKQEDLSENEFNKNSDNQENRTTNKMNNSGNSLLDRMILEATKKTNNQEDSKKLKENFKNEEKVEEDFTLDKKIDRKDITNQEDIVKKDTKNIKEQEENQEDSNKLKDNFKNEEKVEEDFTLDKKYDKDNSTQLGDKKEVEKLQNSSFVSLNGSNEEFKSQKNKEILNSSDKKIFVKNEQTILLDENILDEIKVDSNEEDVLIKNQKSNDFFTTSFLSSQKNSVLSQMIMNKSVGLKTLQGAETLKDITSGAKILDLGLEDIDVQIDDENATFNEIKQRVQNNSLLLNKLALNTSVIEKVVDDTLQTTNQVLSSSLSKTNVDLSNSKDESVDINVNPTLALSIQNKIIGAKQQLSSMMSDIARSMYENYKPPVTAFRINLMPSQLGHIAILMKNTKDNSLSINLSLSESSTHDAMVENQGVLRDSLHKTFNQDQNQTSFDLDFQLEDSTSKDSSSNGNNNQNGQNKQSNFKENSSDDMMQTIINNQDLTEDSNYM